MARPKNHTNILGSLFHSGIYFFLPSVAVPQAAEFPQEISHSLVIFSSSLARMKVSLGPPSSVSPTSFDTGAPSQRSWLLPYSWCYKSFTHHKVNTQGLPEVLTAPSFLRQQGSSVLQFSCNLSSSVKYTFMFKGGMMIVNYVSVGLNCISKDESCGVCGPVLKFQKL